VLKLQCVRYEGTCCLLIYGKNFSYYRAMGSMQYNFKILTLGPKLKHALFALYRPLIFGLGRSVGKMYYFFFKHSHSKR